MPHWNRACEIWGPDAPPESGPDYYGEPTPEERAADALAEAGTDPAAIRDLMQEHLADEPSTEAPGHAAWLRMFDTYARAYVRALGVAA